MYAERAVFATNPWCLSLLGLHRPGRGRAHGCGGDRTAGGCHLRRYWFGPRAHRFYTLDLPYLWGRVTADGCAVIGGGTTGRGNVDNARADAPDAVRLFERPGAPAFVVCTRRWAMCVSPIAGWGLYAQRNDIANPIITSIDEDSRVLVATRLSRARCGSLRACGQSYWQRCSQDTANCQRGVIGRSSASGKHDLRLL